MYISEQTYVLFVHAFTVLNVHVTILLLLCFLQDPHVLPQFLYTSREADALSVTTEVNYLYEEQGKSLLNHDSLPSLINSMKNDEKTINSPKLIMDRFINGCHQRVWESSHESLSSAPSPQLQKDGKRNPCEEVAKVDATTLEASNPIPSDPQLNSDSNDSKAQHYTIPLQTSGLCDSYIPSGSSGYGTCSDHYFESGSSAYTGPTCDYFKSRLADVAECNSLSTCGDEERHQTTVDIMKHSKDTSRSHLVKSNYDNITTTCTDSINYSRNNELQTRCSSLNDYTQSPIPPEHYFTDDEGYLRFSKETAV